MPRSRGSTDRVSNLTFACRECNQAKGNKLPKEWLKELKKSRRAVDKRQAENIPKVLSQLKEPLKSASYMNATRYILVERLKALGLPVLTATAAFTKYNRARFGLPKTDYYDACCVGEVPGRLEVVAEYVQVFRAVGRGTRKMAKPDRYGFPRGHRLQKKVHFGFMTGDLVVAKVPAGKYAGRYIGYVTVRRSEYFDLKSPSSSLVCHKIAFRYFKLIQRFDGWRYEKFKIAVLPSPHLKVGSSSAA